ncbi:hypothetical protein O3P69_009857 [Scylla paramamosain]|uniref:Uncharacterized protein n=1 Tax=Scylla paramamosain TaxID=85552 RepID=A0AAW0SMW4_SCYPA
MERRLDAQTPSLYLSRGPSSSASVLEVWPRIAWPAIDSPCSVSIGPRDATTSHQHVTNTSPSRTQTGNYYTPRSRHVADVTSGPAEGHKRHGNKRQTLVKGGTSSDRLEQSRSEHLSGFGPQQTKTVHGCSSLSGRTLHPPDAPDIHPLTLPHPHSSTILETIKQIDSLSPSASASSSWR